jgi:hypothetical protein
MSVRHSITPTRGRIDPGLMPMALAPQVTYPILL